MKGKKKHSDCLFAFFVAATVFSFPFSRNLLYHLPAEGLKQLPDEVMRIFRDLFPAGRLELINLQLWNPRNDSDILPQKQEGVTVLHHCVHWIWHFSIFPQIPNTEGLLFWSRCAEGVIDFPHILGHLLGCFGILKQKWLDWRSGKIGDPLRVGLAVSVIQLTTSSCKYPPVLFARVQRGLYRWASETWQHIFPCNFRWIFVMSIHPVRFRVLKHTNGHLAGKFRKPP